MTTSLRMTCVSFCLLALAGCESKTGDEVGNDETSTGDGDGDSGDGDGDGDGDGGGDHNEANSATAATRP